MLMNLRTIQELHTQDDSKEDFYIRENMGPVMAALVVAKLPSFFLFGKIFFP